MQNPTRPGQNEMCANYLKYFISLSQTSFISF